MKYYEVHLVGGKVMTIDQEQKDTLDDHVVKKTKDLIALGTEIIKLAAIRSVVKKEELKIASSKNKNDWEKENHAWSDECREMSKLHPDTKIANDMNLRILPGLKEEHIRLSDPTSASMRSSMQQFYATHPIYPRCPAYIWFPFVSPGIKGGKASRWWEIVIANDNAIQEWVTFQGRAS